MPRTLTAQLSRRWAGSFAIHALVLAALWFLATTFLAAAAQAGQLFVPFELRGEGDPEGGIIEVLFALFIASPVLLLAYGVAVALASLRRGTPTSRDHLVALAGLLLVGVVLGGATAGFLNNDGRFHLPWSTITADEMDISGWEALWVSAPVTLAAYTAGLGVGLARARGTVRLRAEFGVSR